MPHGFKNRPAACQRAIQLMLGDLIEDCCLIYVDDILGFDETIEERVKNLDNVPDRLEKYKIKEIHEERIEVSDNGIFQVMRFQLIKLSLV